MPDAVGPNPPSLIRASGVDRLGECWAPVREAAVIAEAFAHNRLILIQNDLRIDQVVAQVPSGPRIADHDLHVLHRSASWAIPRPFRKRDVVPPIFRRVSRLSCNRKWYDQSNCQQYQRDTCQDESRLEKVWHKRFS
jgi:hypothetical protein